jgi:CRP-like cAMP-binding protein
MDVTAALRNVDLFKDVPEPGLRAIAEIAEPITLSVGDVVVVEGGPPDALYVIRSGSCRIFKEKGGDARSVVQVHAVDQFGASSLLDREPRSATVIAVEPTELLAFPAERLTAVLQKDPATAAAFYRALALSLFRRLRQTTDDLGMARLHVAERSGVPR